MENLQSRINKWLEYKIGHGDGLLVSPENLLKFIESELKLREDEIKGIIKSKKQSQITDICDCGREIEFRGYGYNQALTDILREI